MGEAKKTARLRKGGLCADIMGWGAVLQKLAIDTDDGPRVITLGFADPDLYPNHSPHFGATAGRFANRIAHGRFTLDGTAYQLSCNQGGAHHLHGGFKGFGKRDWTLAEVADDKAVLTLVSAAGEEGYPGTMHATTRYILADGSTLRVELEAVSDAPTLVNLVHHSYFNLDGGGDILQSRLMIDADHYTPVTPDLIPTGEIVPVAGTLFDFRSLRTIRGDDGGKPFAYDHNFVLNRQRRDAQGLYLAARLVAARGDLAMEVWTTELGMQFYAGAKINTK
ncbi:MAG: galactose mutarotase, partial [Alphaproteobacteria bacterium]